jgi:hypothetical protein
MTGQQGSSECSPTVRVLVLLRANVSTHLFQFKAHGGHGIPAGPEMLTREVALLAPKLSCYGNRTLAFQEANHLRNGILGRDGQTHMHMIRHDMTLNNLTLLLAGQGMEDRSQLPPNLAIQLAPPSLGTKMTWYLQSQRECARL